MCMSTKTITLSEDAYESLRMLKQVRESFSDVVRRLTVRKPLTEFAGLLAAGEANQLAAVVREGRARSRARARQLRGKLE